MKERRKCVRIGSSFKIIYQVISPPDGGHGDSTSIDISEGGISIPVNQRLFPGVILDLAVYLQRSVDPISATAEVIWIDDSKSTKSLCVMGLKFIKITLRDRDRIYYHIHKMIEREGRLDVGWIN